MYEYIVVGTLFTTITAGVIIGLWELLTDKDTPQES